MNTLEWTKIVGGLCGSLLILLLIQWGSELTYHSGHQKIQTASYYLEIEVEEEEEETDVVKVPFVEMVALAYLHGIVGRKIASVEDYSYSSALAEMTGVWSEDELNAFLLKPSKYAPGTKMSYAGLNPLKDRANLIAYLKTIED